MRRRATEACASLAFAKLVLKHFTQCGACCKFVFTVDLYIDISAKPSSQHHYSHDAFGIDFAAVAAQLNLAFE